MMPRHEPVDDLKGYYEGAGLGVKRKLLSSIFPEKLIIDDGKYRALNQVTSYHYFAVLVRVSSNYKKKRVAFLHTLFVR